MSLSDLPPILHRSGSWKSRFFGTLTARQIALRFAVDLTLANVALLLAVTTRLVWLGRIGWNTDLGTICQRIADGHAQYAASFLAFVAALVGISGLYRPVPTSRIGKRIGDVARVAALGLLTHAFFWTVLLNREFMHRSVAVGAWCYLFLLLASVRAWRMYLGSQFRLVPRQTTAGRRVDDVLVVGGAGYIGSVLTRELLGAGYRVRVLDLGLFGYDSLDEIRQHPRLEIVHGDFRNVEDIVRACRGMDAVVHLAAIVGDPACAIDQATTIAVNYGAARLMAQLAQAAGITRFLFASTCSVYGDGASDAVLTETSELHPVSLYATTKIDAERALLETADSHFRPTILRLSTAYGWSYRPRFDLVANLLSAQAVTDRKITIFNGEQWRPFVHTRDIARAFLAALQAPLELVGGEIFNVGDDSQNFTLAQLGEIIAAQVPGTVIEHRRNNEDPRNYRVSFDKIRHTLGFRAAVPLEAGVREIIDAVSQGKVADWRDAIHSNVRQMKSEGLDLLNLEQERQVRFAEMEATRRFLAKAG